MNMGPRRAVVSGPCSLTADAMHHQQFTYRRVLT